MVAKGLKNAINVITSEITKFIDFSDNLPVVFLSLLGAQNSFKTHAAFASVLTIFFRNYDFPRMTWCEQVTILGNK